MWKYIIFIILVLVLISIDTMLCLLFNDVVFGMFLGATNVFIILFLYNLLFNK